MTPLSLHLVFDALVWLGCASLCFYTMATDTSRDEHLSGLTLLAIFIVAFLGWWLWLPVCFVSYWRTR